MGMLSTADFRLSTSDLLRRVARSFYITIRLLPTDIRASVALAYLLARASDSVADQVLLGGWEKLIILETLGRAPFCNPVWCDDIATRLSKKSEQDLWHALPSLLACLRTSPDEDLIQTVWNHILQGQRTDVEWFEIENRTALSIADLQKYLYLVAGSVGELWTSLIARHMPRQMLLPVDAMSGLGVEYGKALQLVNILRDSNDDNKMGRHYVHAEERDYWMKQAWDYTRSGHRYCKGLKRGRLRFATATPLMLCEATLDLIVKRGAGAKLSRRVVYQILICAALKHF